MNIRTFEDGHSFSLTLAIVCLYLILSPVWVPNIAPRAYDNSRYLELGALGLLLVTFATSAGRDAAVLAWLSLGKRVRWLILALLAGGSISVAASNAANVGLLEVALIAQLIMLVLLVSAARREGGYRTDNALVVAIFTGAALCVLKFWETYLLYALEGKNFPWVSPFLIFANVRFFSQYQSYALLLMALPGLMSGRKPVRALCFFVAANFWALHWMVGTRAAWLGLLAGAVVVLAARTSAGRACGRRHLSRVFPYCGCAAAVDAGAGNQVHG